jgi:hypothetical protein
MKTVKFKHSLGFLGGDGGVNIDPVCTGTYHGGGKFSVIYMDDDGELVITLQWDEKEAERLFREGLWVKVPAFDAVEFYHKDDPTFIYEGRVDGDDYIVEWGTNTSTYAIAFAEKCFAEGAWLRVKPPVPELTDLELARTMIKEQKLSVQLNGDNYQVDGFNSYRANTDAELLKICQLLKELSQYG